jgi:hypothetical protein
MLKYRLFQAFWSIIKVLRSTIANKGCAGQIARVGSRDGELSFDASYLGPTLSTTLAPTSPPESSTFKIQTFDFASNRDKHEAAEC